MWKTVQDLWEQNILLLLGIREAALSFSFRNLGKIKLGKIKLGCFYKVH